MSSDCEGRTQEDIGKDIEEWRARAGLTQLQLALIIGLKMIGNIDVFVATVIMSFQGNHYVF